MKRSGLIYIVAGVVLALLAGVLLFVYLSRLTSQASQVPTPTPIPNIDVIVAAEDLKAGTLLTGDMLKRESRPANEVGFDTLREVTEAVDRLVVLETKAGSTLKRGDLQAVPFVLPKGKKAMALFVDDQSSVAGLVRERDYVDIVINSKIKLKKPEGTPGANDAPQPQAGASTGLFDPLDEQVTVKAALQRVQVLKVIAPQPQNNQQGRTNQPPPAQTTPGPLATATAQAQAEEIAQQGRILNTQAIIILAVTDQEAELLRYAREAGGFQLILRGREDEALEETRGMTLDILIREYGLPVPKPVVVDLLPE